jgi:hypothetical protein
VAASAVGAGMGRAAGDAMAASGSIKAAFSSWGNTYGQIAHASVSGFAAGMTANIVRGGTQTVIQVATDAFGNALGGSMAELLDAEGVQEHALRLREDARDAAMHRIVTGGGGAALGQAGNAMPDGSRKWLSRSTGVPDAQAQQTMRDGAARIRGMQAYGQGVQVASAALPGEVVSDAGGGAGSAPEPEVSWDKYADDVDNYDLMGNAPQVGVAGRQARQGAWGIAKSLAGPGASNAEINRIKNQLLTLNPELAGGGVKAGQRCYVPGQDTAENVALARQADGVYAQSRMPASAQTGAPASDLTQVLGYANSYPALAREANALGALVANGSLSAQQAQDAPLASPRAHDTLAKDYAEPSPVRDGPQMTVWDPAGD